MTPEEFRKTEENQKKALSCYLIDKRFCDITRKRIVNVMEKVARLEDSGDAKTEILNDLADIREFFQAKSLRDYSTTLKNSIDMERFINPGKPIIEG